MTAPKVALFVAELVPRFKEEQVFIIEAFLVHSFRESGRKGVVLGLSGGVDSAAVLALMHEGAEARLPDANVVAQRLGELL